MSSSKRLFEPRLFAGRLFAGALWRGAATDTIFAGSIGICVSGREPSAAVSCVTSRASMSSRIPEAAITAAEMGCPDG